MTFGYLKHWHPLVRLLIIIFIFILSSVVFTSLFVLISIPFIGINEVLALFSGGASIATLKYFQIVNSISMFVIPPFISAILFSRHPLKWLKFGNIEVKYVIITILLFISIQPIVSFVGYYNLEMNLPAKFHKLELWMISAEEAAKVAMFKLLETKSVIGVLINIFMIAIIPAVGEELLFRGTLQPTFKKIFKNHHVAVWLTAFIFSAVHMQFFTFFPRFLLGLLLGYILVFGKRIWYPIVGHFVNNFLSILVFYYFRITEPDINPFELDADKPDIWLVFASVLLLVGLIGYFSNNLKWKNGYFTKK